MVDRKGQTRRYGFVSLADWDDAQAAIATMSGQWLAGQPLRVQWAATRPSSPDQLVSNIDKRFPPAREPANTTICASSFAVSDGVASRAASASKAALSLLAQGLIVVMLRLGDPSSSAASGARRIAWRLLQELTARTDVGNLQLMTTPAALWHLFSPFGTLLESVIRAPAGNDT